MSRVTTAKLSRAAVMAGVSAMALMGAQEAAAQTAPVTVNNYQVSGVTLNSNGTCSVGFTATLTNNTSTQQLVDFGISDSSGNKLPNQSGNDFPYADSIAANSTRNTSGADGAQLTGPSQHVAPYMSAFSSGPQYQFISYPPASNTIVSIPIPDSALVAAGGGCLRLRENNEPVVATIPDYFAQGLPLAPLSATASDLDQDSLTYQWTQVSGPAVTINNANSLNATFTPARAGTTQQIYVFEISAGDGYTTSTDQIIVSQPANSAPTASAGIDRIIQPNNAYVVLDGGGTGDADNDPLTYSWVQVSGTPVTLRNANSQFADFTSPGRAATDQLLVFELTVDDGLASSTDTVTLTLPANLPPVVDAGPDATVSGNTPVELSGSATDPESDPLSNVQWTQIAGPSVTLSTPNNYGASFTTPPKTNSQQVLTFQLSVDDNQGNTGADTVDVIVLPNVGPTADAGADQTAAGSSSVTLDASASVDGDGDPITYSWTQTSGPTVSLSDSNAAQPTFIAPVKTSAAQTLTFDVTVDDGLATSTDSVTITVPANVAPVADAGVDQTVSGSAAITLDATGSSDADGDPLTYSWVQTSGPSVTITNANAAEASFTAPVKTSAVQTLTFEVTVSDGVTSTTDTIQVQVAANSAPLANAGPDQSVAGSSTVTLDGTGSADNDNDPLSYSWVQTSGPAVSISNANTGQPTFTAPAKTGSAQTLTFELTIDDGVATSTDTVTITVAANAAPTADAGPDQIAPGSSTVTLDATGSTDPDGDLLSYAFTQVSGPAVVLTGANTAQPTFTAPAKTGAAQTLVFEVQVSDGVATATDQITVTIPANAAPTADAGTAQTVAGRSVVSLDATGSSDADGDPLTYGWVQTSGPSVSLSDATAAQPTFTAPQGATSSQVLSFEVTVSDGVASSTATVDITISPNSPPVAEAGADQGPVDSGQTVTLDGTGSSDPDNDALTYSWTQVSGTQVTLSDPAAASPTFTAPLVNGTEDLVFQLVVSDGQASSAADTVTIAIRAVGTITIVQQVAGDDTTVSYNSALPALSTSVTTSGGTATLEATGVAAGSYAFSVTDLTAQGYALTGFACNDSDSAVDLASGSATLALSPSEDLVCTITLADTRSAAQTAIRDFLNGRNALLLSNQPDLQRRLDRLRGTVAGGGMANIGGIAVPGASALPMAMQMNPTGGNFQSSLAMAAAATGDIERKRQLDIWTDLTYADVTLGDNRGSFRLAYLGADYLVNPDLLVGALVQVDEFKRKGGLESRAAAEGTGWMVGPYVTAKLSDQLYGDARVAYGKSDNSVSPLGTYVDGFDTERMLFSGSLVGVFDLDERTRIWPEASLRYIREKQGGYVDSYNVAIPGQSIQQGEAAFSPRIEYTASTGGNWMLRPYAEFEGLLTFGAIDDAVVDNGLRGRANGGIDAASQDGVRLNLSGFYDGIGESDFEAAGVSVGISFRF